jgi:hypothetical protein
MMKNNVQLVKTADAAGFGVLCSACAMYHKALLVIIPQINTDQELSLQVTEHENKSNAIYDILSEIEGLKLIKISYKEREVFEGVCWDPIADLKAKMFTLDDWRKLSTVRLSFKKRENPYVYYGLIGKKNTLVVFQKFISDEHFGVNAAMQSLSADDFTTVWDSTDQKVYGQHFHKVNDREAVEAFAAARKVYVPGLIENHDVFGIRGRKHGDYAGMYENVQKAVAIPGTHTWIMLFFYPEIHQLIPYRTGIENWSEIAQAWREAGNHIYTVEFNDSSYRESVRAQIAFGYKNL